MVAANDWADQACYAQAFHSPLATTPLEAALLTRVQGWLQRLHRHRQGDQRRPPGDGSQHLVGL